MISPDLACLDFRECSDLPFNTLVAPLEIVREIRCLLGETGIRLVVGTGDAVLVSPDVFAAFSAWHAEQSDEPDEEDTSWLN